MIWIGVLSQTRHQLSYSITSSMSTTTSRVSSNKDSRSLENVEITLLNQVNASNSKVDVTNKVRIIKLWKLPSFKIKGATHSVDVILMDEDIQATVMGSYLSKHGKLLVERECVLIMKFEVGDNVSQYRLTNHKHRLFFDYDTNMMRCNDAVGSPHGFSFTEFDLFLNNALPSNFVVDIIGYLYTYFDMYDHKTQNGQLKKKRNIQVRDAQNRNIYVQLWESLAEKMQKFVDKKPNGVTVLILQTGKFTFSGGKAYVSSAFHGSTLFINDDIEEIIAFKRSLLEKESDDSVSSRRLVSSQSVTSLQEEFLGDVGNCHGYSHQFFSWFGVVLQCV
ncbi:putative replication protein A, OB [Helianthus debilis subsp. tardiflorus]